MKLRYRFLASLPIALYSSIALSCPAVGRIADYNCDGKASIAILGDSLVAGIGDTKYDNTGGYAERIRIKFPDASVYSLGIPGLRTQTLLKLIQKAFKDPSNSALAQALLEADIVIIDLGRNDRWLFGLPIATLRNLKRIRSSIEDKVETQTGNSPFIVQAVLMFPNRGAQGPWVKELDELILKSHTTTLASDLRFDLVSKRLLQPDNIHPTSKGYSAMATVLEKYLLKEYRTYAAALRADDDDDGLYDLFERARYGTDPANPDSDGDGIKDGNDPSPIGG